MVLPLIVITGPTGVGKSDFAEKLSIRLRSLGGGVVLDGEIVNADVGQFYKPLSVGTAKPKLPHPLVKHHLFNIIGEPESFSCVKYRELVEETLKGLSERTVPLVVGGSLFYISELFFTHPGTASAHTRLTRLQSDSDTSNVEVSSLTSWARLWSLDPERAEQLHPRDTYRIERALYLAGQGIKASSCQAVAHAVRPHFMVICVTRSREELHERIKYRVKKMLESGWIEEVEGLSDAWKRWCYQKKIIGYNDILDALAGKCSLLACEESIIKKTKGYSKRQMTFWRGFSGKLEARWQGSTREVNLTLSPIDLYLDKIVGEIMVKVSL